MDASRRGVAWDFIRALLCLSLSRGEAGYRQTDEREGGMGGRGTQENRFKCKILVKIFVIPTYIIKSHVCMWIVRPSIFIHCPFRYEIESWSLSMPMDRKVFLNSKWYFNIFIFCKSLFMFLQNLQ